MRNILTAPGWILAYHKPLARFTDVMFNKINKLDRFSLTDLSPSPVCPYRNVQIILSEVGSWPFSSMLVSHSTRIMVRDARYMRESLDEYGWNLARLARPARLAGLSSRQLIRMRG